MFGICFNEDTKMNIPSTVLDAKADADKSIIKAEEILVY